MNTRKLLPAALAITIGLATTACGGDDDSSAAIVTEPPAATVTEPPVTEPPAPTVTEPPVTEPPVTEPAPTDEPDDVITVAMSDFAFGGLPETVPLGTRLQVENISETEMHELVAIRIPDDENRSVEELLTLPEDELDAIFGAAMPAMVLLAPPGGPQIEAVGDGTFNEPGRYAVVCFIPTGADPAEFMAAAAESEGPPQVDGGPPHIVHGMYAEVVVE